MQFRDNNTLVSIVMPPTSLHQPPGHRPHLQTPLHPQAQRTDIGTILSETPHDNYILDGKPEQQRTMATPAAIPPHLRAKCKVVPPHLRPKPAQAAAKTDVQADDATKATPPVQVQTSKAPSTKTATPPARSASATATGLAASQHAPSSANSRVKSESRGNNDPPSSPLAGVKISETQQSSKPSLVAYASSEEQDASPTRTTVAAPLPKNESPPSPPKKSPIRSSQVDAPARPTYAAAAAPHNSSNLTAKGSKARSPTEASTHPSWQSARNSRGNAAPQRGPARGGRAPRDSKWPKHSEIPKGDPERWAIKWDDNYGEACSIDSARADSGWGGEGKLKPATPKDGIDPETGFLLTDFSGNWAPAPINWDSRPAFRAEQSVETIEKWQCNIESAMAGSNWKVPQSDLVAPDGQTYYFAPDPKRGDLLIQGDPAPRDWVPLFIGTESPKMFWSKLIASKTPPPVDEGDLDGVKPWWETYVNSYSCSVKPCEHPADNGVQPTETQQEKFRRENDNGSLHHAENRKRAEIAKKDADREKRKKAMEKAKKLSVPAGPSREVKSELKLYLRPACPEDLPRITEIYNYYVENTVFVPETERRNDNDMLQRYNDVIMKKMPFIVACERGSFLKSRKGRGEPIALPEKLVGFAHADDHHDLKGMYRFTSDVEVYVDATQYMKGIGKCLTDKLLAMLDPDYVERGRYDVEGAALEGTGPSRVISNIIATVPYGKADGIEWKSRFLTDFGGFTQVGRMEGVGVKLGKT